MISEAHAFSAMGAKTTPTIMAEFRKCQEPFLAALHDHDPGTTDVAFGAFLFWRALQLTAQGGEGKALDSKPAMKEVKVVVPRISLESLRDAVTIRNENRNKLMDVAEEAQPDAMEALLRSMKRAAEAAEAIGASSKAKHKAEHQASELMGFCMAVVAQSVQLERGFAK